LIVDFFKFVEPVSTSSLSSPCGKCTDEILISAKTSSLTFPDQVEMRLCDADSFVAAIRHGPAIVLRVRQQFRQSRRNASLDRTMPIGVFG